MRMGKTKGIALVAVALAACDGSTEPPAQDLVVAVQGGDGQIAAAGQPAADPLQVVVSDAATEDPVPGVAVEWQVITGTGATLVPAVSQTDSSGIASTRITMGPDSGTYEVRAAAERMVGTGPVFRIHAITDPPTLSAIEPSAAMVGDTVELRGDHFSTTPEENRVLFAGVPALVVSATTTVIRAVVPICLPSRSVAVTVSLGPFASSPILLQVDGATEAPLALDPGDVVTVTPATVGCLRLPASPAGTEFLVITQNATDAVGEDLAYRLVGVAGAPQAVTAVRAAVDIRPALRTLSDRGTGPVAAAFEADLRRREREIPRTALLPPSPTGPGPFLVQPPQVGDQKRFNVLNEDDRFTEVTAVVKYVSNHAVIYEDVRAPLGGLTASDFQRFGQLFDDPIYQTDVDVYGAPSDVDSNGLVTILFTPVVNELTPKGSPGFIVGFFFGHDLTTGAGSNRGEIFYSAVPDPSGVFGDPRRTDRILEVVPPVLAHEFMHMIHFNQRVFIRGVSQESLWLAEALAHMAEDLVGEVFLDRGDIENAADFKASNYARALLYLQEPDTVSLLAYQPPGELGERGAGWLFLRYLMGQYGGQDLVTRLTQTTRSSVSNVRAETGGSWPSLLSDWFVAMYADDAPELAGTALPRRFTYPELNLRQIFGQVQGGFPLRPQLQTFQDFVVSDTLPAASPDYLLVQAGSTPRTLNLSLTAGVGIQFPASAQPQVTVLRIR